MQKISWLIVTFLFILGGCITASQPIPTKFPIVQEIKLTIQGVDTVKITEDKEEEEQKLSIFTFIIKDTAYTQVYGEITQGLPYLLWQDLLVLKNKKIKKLCIYVNSFGGSVTAAFTYINLLQNAQKGLDGLEITTFAAGTVASAAMPIFLTGKRRIALKSSMFMLHEGVRQAEYVRETQKEMKIQAELFRMLMDQYVDVVVKRSNLTKEDVREKMDSTTWFTVKEAKKWGMLEEIK